MDICLPGFAARFTRVEVTREDTGDLTVRVTACDDSRFVSRTDVQVYEALTPAEALDVVSASLDGLWSA